MKVVLMELFGVWCLLNRTWFKSRTIKSGFPFSHQINPHHILHLFEQL